MWRHGPGLLGVVAWPYWRWLHDTRRGDGSNDMGRKQHNNINLLYHSMHPVGLRPEQIKFNITYINQETTQYQRHLSVIKPDLYPWMQDIITSSKQKISLPLINKKYHYMKPLIYLHLNYQLKSSLQGIILFLNWIVWSYNFTSSTSNQDDLK